ncbi:MAG TPA: FAD-dependent oxidoreductase [Patescibacteria group bacterium]|nr:FAD-dependent oxidoreductase [Patescibacteria group bacterium]
MTASPPDVIVLGGGVIGLSCAHALARGGRSVTVLERALIGAGASHGNCGTITPSHALPLAQPGVIAQGLRWLLKPDAPLRIAPTLNPTRLAWLARFALNGTHAQVARIAPAKAAILNRSRALIEAFIRDEAIDCDFAADGELQVFRDRRNFDDACRELAILRAHGVPVEVWDGARVERDEPALKPGVVGGLYWPNDAHIRPDRYVAALAERARAAGVVIREDATVSGFDVAAGRIAAVHVDRARLRAGAIVLAGGAWSPLMARDLGLRLPIQPGKGYSITFSRPARAPKRPLVLAEPRVCVTTWASGFRLGSTMEFAGYDDTLNRVRLDALVRGADDFLHEPAGLERLEEWWGWRPMTTDDLPIIGASTRIDGLWLATGHGMLGMSMANATAELLAAQMLGRETVIDPRAYLPARFAL